MKKVASGYRLIFGYLGIFLAVTGVIMLLPIFLLVIPAFRDDVQYIWNFVIPGLSTLVAGILLFVLLLLWKD